MRDPFADQRGLAEAGRGRDEGQFSACSETIVQPLDQAGADNHFWRRRGDIKLGSQDWRRGGHEAIIVCTVGLPPFKKITWAAERFMRQCVKDAIFEWYYTLNFEGNISGQTNSML